MSTTSEVTVLTDDGVRTGTILDPEMVAELARWLCQEREAHDGHVGYLGDTAWEAQVKENGGYCNYCRDFAGELLVNFSLVSNSIACKNVSSAQHCAEVGAA